MEVSEKGAAARPEEPLSEPIQSAVEFTGNFSGSTASQRDFRLIRFLRMREEK